ncbi:hypothetical protein [Noviherbaspirillum autotrophicum]|nr:hypothetical protein [Noviherbaspirillum autotrophicum]
MAECPVFTYQIRIATVEDSAVLDAYAQLYGRAEKVIGRRQLYPSGSNKLHQKKPRWTARQARLRAMRRDDETGTARLCVGGRKLFSAQVDLQTNSYTSHAHCGPLAAMRCAWQRQRDGW